MTAPERPGPERPGPDYPAEWDLEDQAAQLWAHDDDHDLRHQWWHPTCDDCVDPVFMACGVPTDAPPGTWEALADLARAAIRAEEQRHAHLTPEQRATEDTHRAESRARLDRIRRRTAADEQQP